MKVSNLAYFLKLRPIGLAILLGPLSLSILAVVSLGCRESVSRGVAPDSLTAGAPAPNFSLPSLDGEPYSLSDFNGRVVLLNFWATWCAPCVAEMPALERLAKLFGEKGLEIVTINHDPPGAIEDVKQFVRDKGLSFKVLLDPELTLPPRFGITGFPETFFIGPDGKFLSFVDPVAKDRLVRIISDRPWDSTAYVQAIQALLEANAVSPLEEQEN